MTEKEVRNHLYGRPLARAVFDSRYPKYALPVKPVMRVNRLRAAEVDPRYADGKRPKS